MIGQTVVNVEMGRARSRISTVAAGLTLLILVTGLSEVMARISMVVLAGIMVIVAAKTANWHSLQPATLMRMPWSEKTVMVLIVDVTVLISDFTLGVLASVIAAMMLFARCIAHVVCANRTISDDGTVAP